MGVKRSHLHHTHTQIYTTHTVGMITVSTMSPTMTEDTKEETKIDYPNLEMEEKTKEEEDIPASEKDGLIPGKISQTASCARPYMDHKIDMSCCVKNFKEFHHRCPRCNAILTTSRYPFSKCLMCFLGFLVVICFLFAPYFGLKYLGFI